MRLQTYTNSKSILKKCYHCGENCTNETVKFDEKFFCCEGCKLVYDILKENQLCTYYNLNNAPGISQNKTSYSAKYQYLDNEKVKDKMIHFTDGETAHITFYIPKIHCSSCIWLLENMHKLNTAIVSSTVNFVKKEVTLVFNIQQIKLSEIAEILANIGYEPQINLNDIENRLQKKSNKNEVIKIGVAGFCFGNIMMLSFPEYFSLGNFYEQKNLAPFFATLNLLLALPVFLYSASGFFISALKSIRYRYLNIDAPIALAILVTFSRSVYEIISQSGAGYMDSMSGIVFFMLIGRYFQNKTYETLSFERDYKSYFPVGVSVKKNNGTEKNIPVSELKKGNIIIIRNNEIIPCDALLLSEQSYIDYSFITGESAPVKKQKGDMIYAGGKQLSGAIELQVINTTSQSYLTQLWNKDALSQQQEKEHHSYIDNINKYFTIIVLLIAFISFAYWFFSDSSKSLNALTAVLIVACPCGLLLTSTFANGNIMRIMGRNKLYLKNADVIDKMAKVDTIVFDKTGTITHGTTIYFFGAKLNSYELQLVTSLAAQSSHPLSRKLHAKFEENNVLKVTHLEEIVGKGLKAIIDENSVILGSEYFVTGSVSKKNEHSTKVFLAINGEVLGYFSFENSYRDHLSDLIQELSKKFELKLLSGDNDAEKEKLQTIFGKRTELLFHQKPEDKKEFIKTLQNKKHNVMMIGDGLNDAGALLQSNVGIAISDDTNNFSPASDAILKGENILLLPAFIRFAKAGKNSIVATFVISLIYNIIGLSFAIQGNLSPVIAAILMPASSISIVLLSTLSTSIFARIIKIK